MESTPPPLQGDMVKVKIPSRHMLQEAASAASFLPWRTDVSPRGPRSTGGGGRREVVGALTLSFGFFFTFTAWHSAQNLQSSLPLHAGVNGTLALAIVYSLLGPGNIIAPAVVRWLGLKLAILLPMGMYSTFIAANMYPRWWTIYPAAALVGLACPPLFVAQNTILTQLSLRYARLNGFADETARVGMFQGIFTSIFMGTQVCGNTFYSLFFLSAANSGTERIGSSSGSGGSSTVPAAPSQHTIVLLFGIYFCLVMFGIVVVALGLKPPGDDDETAARLGSGGSRALLSPVDRAAATATSTTAGSSFSRLDKDGTYRSQMSFSPSRQAATDGSFLLALSAGASPPMALGGNTGQWARRGLCSTLGLLRSKRMIALIPYFLGSSFLGSFMISDFTAKVVTPALGVGK